MTVMVIDGQGGGIGRAIVEKLAGELPVDCELIAVGTNSIATVAMKKAGATEAATGENAVIWNARRADIIIGAIGIIAANSIMGELSPAMANAIASSEAVKLLIPSDKCKLRVVSVYDEPLGARIERAVETALQIVKKGCL